jgi:hypothetical protein
MTRYRSARIVPGVNPPAGTESDEMILATRGESSPEPSDRGCRPAPSGTSIVGIWEGALMACPHEEQNRLSGRFSAEHFGHWIIGNSFLRFQLMAGIICDKQQDAKHVYRERRIRKRAFSRIFPFGIGIRLL